MLYDVPIGFGVLEVWAEDDYGYYLTEMKTMNVLVYPEIRCVELATVDGQKRWHLLPPTEEALPFSRVKLGPMPVPERLIRPIRLEDGVYTIDAALWKQSDDYFVVDAKEDRYEPSKIKDYNHQDVNFSVDEQEARQEPDGMRYCAPNPLDDPYDEEVHKRCALPQYESERVEVVVLQLLETLEPRQGGVPLEQQGPQPISARAGREQ